MKDRLVIIFCIASAFLIGMGYGQGLIYEDCEGNGKYIFFNQDVLHCDVVVKNGKVDLPSNKKGS